MDRATLLEQIYQDLQQSQAKICSFILYDLLFGDWDLDNISFADLAFYSEDQKELLKLLPYLMGDRTHLLDLRMYYLDENEVRHELTKSQMRGISFGKEVRHPVTNELLDYVASSERIYIYYAASDLIKGLRNNV